MSLNFAEITIDGIHVVYEPGDLTRYDFIFFEFYDDILIIPYNSTFSFPQRMIRFVIKNVIDRFNQKEITIEEAAVQLGNYQGVNPNTTVQVAKAIYSIIFGGENNGREKS